MPAPDLLVLCYHAVSPTWPAPLSVTPTSLRRQLEGLVRRGYRSATFTDAVGGRRVRPTVCVTFDDAYASVLAEALPLLEGLGLRGTVFAPSAFVGDEDPMTWPGIDGWLHTSHREELTPMSWDDLALLREHGWEIGSHTCTHPRLTQLDDDALDRELGESKREIEARLGVECSSLAYPYGDCDDRVIEAARRAGYRAAGALPTRFLAATELAWPRVGIYHADSPTTYALKTSRLVRSVRRTPAWNAAYRAARALR
jgi:peptidoglycan/xylan/chitin deacetylase (PgdA/CDA1 family)